MATYQFGAIGDTNVAEGDYGLLQNFNTSYSADEATAQNGVGDVAAQEIYNESTEITCEYVADTAKSLPVPGDTVTVGATDKYTVLSSSSGEENTGFTKWNFTLKRYTAVGVPANA